MRATTKMLCVCSLGGGRWVRTFGVLRIQDDRGEISVDSLTRWWRAGWYLELWMKELRCGGG
jgi:hypothetical protein